MRKKKYIYMGIIILGALVTIGFLLKKNSPLRKSKQSASNYYSDSNKNNFKNPASCGNNKALFTVMPVSFKDIFKLTPIGSVSPPDHVFPPPHLYMYIIDYTNPKAKIAKVYSPGEMTLIQMGIRHYKKLNHATNYTDYTLVFSRCADVDMYFHHVSSLTYPPFIDAANRIMKKCNFGGFKNEEFCSGQVNIPIKTGTQIGTSGDLNAGVYGLDMGVRDYRIASGKSFINPDRVCGRENNVYSPCYTVCPFDYFSQEIQDKLSYSDVNPDVKTRENLSCGTVYADIKNTAQGYWFAKNPGNDKSTYSSEAFNLYIGQDSTKPSVKIFSTGVSVPHLQAGKYDFVPQNSGTINRDPSQIINDGKIYCYKLSQRGHNNNKTLLLQMENNTTLKIEAISVGCNSTTNFSSNWVEFVR